MGAPEPIDAQLRDDAARVLGALPTEIVELPHSTRTTATRRVCRVRTATRSAVVKVLAPDTRDGTDPYSAAREPAIYSHGLPASFSDAGIALPALLYRSDTPTEIVLWLEDLAATTGASLTPREYERVGRRLGRAHAAAMTRDMARADIPWSHNFLASYITTWNDVGWARIYDDDAWSLPLVRAHFSPQLRRDLVALCEQRHEILGWANRLPQTICHHDVWPNNVFDSDEHTALIDWAFAGIGALGCDVGNLVTDSCGDLLLPTSMLGELDAAATAGYRAGLGDAGWAGNFAAARLGMCLMAAKWCWLTPHMLRLAERDRHGVYGNAEVDTNQLFAERAAMLRFNADLAAEARALASALRL